jgi:transposase
MKTMYSPKEFGELIGKSVISLQKWDRKGILTANRSPPNRRYYITGMLSYKRHLYGKELVFVDERNTSKAFSGCGHLQPMSLWKRTYRCTKYGPVMDRDYE